MINVMTKYMTNMATSVTTRTMLYVLTFVMTIILTNVSHAGVNDKNHGDITLPCSAVSSVYDADTFRVDIVGWPTIIGERIAIRVNGVDAPELRSSCKTDAAKQREKALGLQAKQMTVKMLRECKTLELRNITRGKYFRIVADVYTDNKSLSEALIAAKLGYPYQGGKKTSWCDRTSQP